MKVSFEGIGENICTFYNSASSAAKAGEPVKMTAGGTVGACTSGDRFCGMAVDVSADFASVKIAGYTVVKYSGTAPSVGYGNLAANGSGGVTVPESGGTEYLIIDVDTTAGTVGFIL